jgi:hypothetical protein
MFPNDTAHETAARRNVAQRVKFDLGCDGAELVRLGDVARLGQQMTRISIGAACADRSATYVVTCVSNWGDISCNPELDSTHQAPPAAPPPAAPAAAPPPPTPPPPAPAAN